MPNYLYVCECGDSTEIQHSIHLDPEVKCKKCSKPMVRKPQGALIKFMAGGFYSVDSKKSESS